MKKFEFSLERVLEIRELKKLLAEERLGQSLRDEKHAKAGLILAEDTRQDLFVKIRQETAGAIDKTEVSRLFKYREAVEDEIYRRQGEFERKQTLTEEARKEAILRTQEQKALEKHKDNHWKEYKARYWWEQGKELDEVGSIRFGRDERR